MVRKIVHIVLSISWAFQKGHFVREWHIQDCKWHKAGSCGAGKSCIFLHRDKNGRVTNLGSIANTAAQARAKAKAVSKGPPLGGPKGKAKAKAKAKGGAAGFAFAPVSAPPLGGVQGPEEVLPWEQ